MKKEYDLKQLEKRPGKVRFDSKAAKVPVSIRIDGSVLAELRTEAERQGIGYQTLIGSILQRFVNGDLIDPRAADLRRLLSSAS